MYLQFLSFTAGVILISCPVTGQTSAVDADLAKLQIQVVEGATRGVSIMDILVSLRKQGLEVNLEMIAGAMAPFTINNVSIERRVFLGKTSMSFDELFRTAVKDLGYAYEVSAGTVTIYSPATREFGEDYPLIKKIDHLEIKGLTYSEAIAAISEKCNISLLAMEFSNQPNLDKKLDISLHDTTVREALTKLTNAVGERGWVSDVHTLRSEGAAPRIIMRVTR